MSKRRTREPISSSSSQETSPKPKSLKMAEEEHVDISQGNLPTLSLIYKTLMEVQEDVKIMRQENYNIQKEYEEIKKSVEYQSNTIDDLTQDNAKLKSICEEQEE